MTRDTKPIRRRRRDRHGPNSWKPLITARRYSASFGDPWPIPTDNKHRLWGFGTPRLRKNTPDVKTTAAGFYAVNGTSVLRSLNSLEQERIGEMFEAVREQNPTGRILLVLDNFSSHICESSVFS